MDSPGTTTLAALFQASGPAIQLDQGGNSPLNQDVTSDDQFKQLLSQLLGGGDGMVGGLPGQPVGLSELLPQGGETLPPSTGDLPVADDGVSGDAQQDQALEILMQQFKAASQAQGVPQAEVTQEDSTTPALNGQLPEGQTQNIPASLLNVSLLKNSGKSVTGVDASTQETAPSIVANEIPYRTLLAMQMAERAKPGAQPEVAAQSNPGIGLEHDLSKSALVSQDINTAALMPLVAKMATVGSLHKQADLDSSLVSGMHALNSTLNSAGEHSAATLKADVGSSVNGALRSPLAPALDTPIDSPQWKTDFSQRILMMTKDGVQTAEVRLNPPHLGPIEVRITLTEDHASVNFSAHHTMTRDAIEGAMPRLRELFQSNGLTLSDAQVFDQSAREQRDKRQPGARYGNGGFIVQDEVDLEINPSHRRYGSLDPGLTLAVDYYA